MITTHAQKRMQQRAIRAELLDIMDMVAMEGHQHGGTYIQQIPHKELDRLIKKTKKLLKILSKASNTYCVRGVHDYVITAGHKTRPLKTTY
ncbi:MULTISPECIES: hypothetical protein [unclassified Endozoicomonas]|uniref:hypothetical protein n=1 Tax=unclassified Endozoicomonas TaxID=2644528 RepID=UPI003BB5B177